MKRVIGVVSAKGGVGKTTIAANLSAAMMSFNENVIAIDADIKMSGLGLQLGMYHFPVTLNDVLLRNASILEALYIHSSGLRIIPASLYARDVSMGRLGRVLEEPSMENNIAIIDTPPGMERNSLSILKACREVIVVTTAEIPAIADVMKTIKAAEKMNCEILGIVVNRYRRGVSEQIKVKETESGCGLPVIGVIPEDRNIQKSLFKRVPCVFMNPYSSASIGFKGIAAYILEKEYKERNVLLKRLLWKLKK
jgi:septum site-determining protein MinD